MGQYLMISFALFGAGRIGAMHAKNIFENGKSKLVYVYDPNKIFSKKIAGKFNCKIADNPDEIFNDKNLNAVLIASPTNTHIELILKAARSKKAIFCEKPIDLDINKINKCEKKLIKYKAPIQIGFNRRYDKSHLSAINKYDKGEIGDIEKIIITSRDPAPPSLEYLLQSGGIFRDMTIHDFDLSRFILRNDVIIEVFASASNLFDKNTKKAKDFDTAMVMMKSKFGVLININNSRRSVYGYDQRLELFGSKGMVISDNAHPTTLKQYSSKYTNSKEPIYHFFIERYNQAYKAQLDSFINNILNKKKPTVTFEDGKNALILANAAYESIKSGKLIRI